MKLKTAQTSDRLPQVTLSINSILRIHEGFKSGRKQASQNLSPEAASKYDALVSSGDSFSQEISALSGSAQEVLPIDRAVDRIVSGIDDVTRGLEKIFDLDSAIPLINTEIDVAKAVQLFRQAALANGTKFLIGPWREEWAEIAQMLSRLSAPGVPHQVGSIDLQPVIDRLTRAQEVYGKALKISYGDEKEPAIITSINAWGEALDDLDTAVSYHHKRDAALRAQVFAPFFDELARLEAANLKEKAKQKTETQTTSEVPGKD